MEHHSNIVPWHFLRERQGAVLKWVDVDDDGSLDAEAVDAAIGPKTKLVAIAHMSNVLGTVAPLKEIVRARACQGRSGAGRWLPGRGARDRRCARSRCRFLCVDRTQALRTDGHRRALWQGAHLKAMRPFNGGGEMIREVTREQVTYADPPARFEAGTPPIIEAVGLAAALD